VRGISEMITGPGLEQQVRISMAERERLLSNEALRRQLQQSQTKELVGRTMLGNALGILGRRLRELASSPHTEASPIVSQ
jgi:hypothetical protein